MPGKYLNGFLAMTLILSVSPVSGAPTGVPIQDGPVRQFGDDGKIRDFKVMVRPIKAVNKLWELMAAQLQAAG